MKKKKSIEKKRKAQKAAIESIKKVLKKAKAKKKDQFKAYKKKRSKLKAILLPFWKDYRKAHKEWKKLHKEYRIAKAALKALDTENKKVSTPKETKKPDQPKAKASKKISSKKATTKKIKSTPLTGNTSKPNTPKAETAPKTSTQTTGPKESTPVPQAANIAKTASDNLKRIEGIGPKIEQLLKEAGINTFADLGAAKVTSLRAILKAAGPRFQMHNPGTWARQAKLAAADNWDQLKALQEELKGGKYT
ncbi:MAG: helix-hairpin-helix domain-containing protein [Bacteroidota bacterium]